MSYDEDLDRRADDDLDGDDGLDDDAQDLDLDEHEGRRNATLAVSVAGVAIVLVGLMFWLMSSLSGPKLVADTSAAAAKPAPTSTTAAAAAAAPETSAAAPPTIATYTYAPSTTFSLPPPEQPTMTAAAPVPSTTQAPAPAPAPTTQAPAPQPPTPSAPAAVSVSNVKLTCSKGDGKRTTGTLSFTTNAKVSAAISVGGDVQSKSAGPGDVTLTAAGRGAPVCIGKVNDQVIGPIPAT